MKSLGNKSILLCGAIFLSTVFQMNNAFAADYYDYSTPQVHSFESSNAGGFSESSKIISVGPCIEVADHQVESHWEYKFFNGYEKEEDIKTCHQYYAVVVRAKQNVGAYVNPDPQGELVLPGTESSDLSTTSFPVFGEKICVDHEKMSKRKHFDAKSSCEAATAAYRASCQATKSCMSQSGGGGRVSRGGNAWSNPYEIQQPWIDPNYGSAE